MDSGAEVPAGSATRRERSSERLRRPWPRTAGDARSPRRPGSCQSVGREVSPKCTRAGYIQQVRGPAGSHHNFEFRVFAAHLAGSSRQLAPRDLSTMLALSSRLNGPTFSHTHAVFHVEPHNPRAIVKLREDSGRALRATCPSAGDLSYSEVDAAPTRRLTT